MPRPDQEVVESAEVKEGIAMRECLSSAATTTGQRQSPVVNWRRDEVEQTVQAVTPNTLETVWSCATTTLSLFSAAW